MTIVEMDARHRITIPKRVRGNFMTKGQKFYLVQYGDDLLVKVVPKDAAKKLDEIIGGFTFDREARRKAEKWLLQETREKSS